MSEYSSVDLYDCSWQHTVHNARRILNNTSGETPAPPDNRLTWFIFIVLLAYCQSWPAVLRAWPGIVATQDLVQSSDATRLVIFPGD